MASTRWRAQGMISVYRKAAALAPPVNGGR
jgi:hypothetical protein